MSPVVQSDMKHLVAFDQVRAWHEKQIKIIILPSHMSNSFIILIVTSDFYCGMQNEETPNDIHTLLAHEREQLLDAQDEQLDLMAQSVRRLKGVAVTMRDEIQSQNVLLDRLEGAVSNVQGRLNRTTRHVDEVLRTMSTSSQCGLLMLLVMTLLVLLFLLFQ